MLRDSLKFKFFLLIAIGLCSCASYLEPAPSDTDFLFSLDKTEFDSTCENAQSVVVENLNKYARQKDRNLIVGETIFLSDRKTCIKQDGYIHLNLLLHVQEGKPLSTVGTLCAKVDDKMNLVAWNPYC